MQRVKETILVVEDERNISNFIHTILTANHYETVRAHTGAEAHAMISSHCPDLIILDLGLPDMDGMELITAVRTWTQLPIIVVSARMREKDKVLALDAGADDYITKPFGTGELLARIRTALRHTRGHLMQPGAARHSVYQIGALTIDYDKRQVTIAGENANLTQNEYKIVSMLGKFAGKVLTYDTIISELWGPRVKGDNQILRVNMANIRRKIEKNPAAPVYILTEVGVGYRLVDDIDF